MKMTTRFFQFFVAGAGVVAIGVGYFLGSGTLRVASDVDGKSILLGWMLFLVLLVLAPLIMRAFHQRFINAVGQLLKAVQD